MEVITKEYVLSSIPNRLKEQYYNDKDGWKDYPWNPKDRYERIVAIGEGITEERATEITNSSWTNLDCHECGQNVDKVVVLGEKPDYESNTAQVCFNCLKKALDLINGY